MVLWVIGVVVIVLPVISWLSTDPTESESRVDDGGDDAWTRWQPASMQYPRNLTRVYQGGYEPISGMPSDRSSGEFQFMLRTVDLHQGDTLVIGGGDDDNNNNNMTGPVTYKQPPVLYVWGEALLRDREQPRETDVGLNLTGVYFLDSGLLHTYANDDDWMTPDRLAELDEMKANNYSVEAVHFTLTRSVTRLEALWRMGLAGRPSGPSSGYSSCVSHLEMQFEKVAAQRDANMQYQRLVEDDNGREPEFDMAGTLKASGTSPESGEKEDPGSGQCRLNLRVWANSVTEEEYYRKATRYGLVAIVVAMAQLRLLRDHMHTHVPTRAIRISIISLGWRTLIDSLYSLAHFTLALSYAALFNTFVIVAVLQFWLFSMCELRVVMKIRSARHPELFETMQMMTRQFRNIYIAFYAAMFILMFVLTMILRYPQVYMPVLFSFWVPQIVMQAKENTHRSMTWSFLVGMSATRFFTPLYLLGCPYNFLNLDVYPGTLTVTGMWLAVQIGVLILQDKLGPRWFVPQRFLPEIYRYHRAIPNRRGGGGEDDEEEDRLELESGSQEDIEMAPLMPAQRQSSSHEQPPVGQEGISDDSDGSDAGDNCAICYCDLRDSDGECLACLAAFNLECLFFLLQPPRHNQNKNRCFARLLAQTRLL